jgi:glycosyltransferase involved in cell wall biosynthesis
MTASPSGTIHAKRVSIILPVYNGARYLRQAIESCLTQTYQNFELIVVDDGSQDNSVEIVKTYTDSRLTLIQHDRNKKLPAALNTGFSHSIGSYLTWTSHDNYYVPTAIAELVQFLEDSRGVDFVYSDEYIIDERDGSVQLDRTGPVERLVEQSCLGGCFLYTRAVYEKLGPYDERLFLAEDYDYWLRALSSFKLAHLDRALYYYRLHPRSLTVLYTADGVELALRIRRRHLTHHPVRYRRPLTHIADALPREPHSGAYCSIRPSSGATISRFCSRSSASGLAECNCSDTSRSLSAAARLLPRRHPHHENRSSQYLR